jgi:transcriptional regulator with XRE-family HTH domain
MNTAQLVDQARHCAGLSSDYALAKHLGISRQVVSQWRSGSKFPAPLLIFRLSELAALNPAQVIADLESDRAQRAGRVDQVEGWRSILQRLGGVAAAVMVGAILSAPAPASAAMKQAQEMPAPSVYYVNKLRRRLQRAARAAGSIARRSALRLCGSGQTSRASLRPCR